MIGACHPDKAVMLRMSCQSCTGLLNRTSRRNGRKTRHYGRIIRLKSLWALPYRVPRMGESRHADGYAFGHEEIAQPLMLNCAKCHYAEGFSDAMATAEEKGITFAEVEFKKPLYPGGPMFFDFDKLPPEKGTGISCQVCHDPHGISLRTLKGSERAGRFFAAHAMPKNGRTWSWRERRES